MLSTFAQSLDRRGREDAFWDHSNERSYVREASSDGVGRRRRDATLEVVRSKWKTMVTMDPSTFKEEGGDFTEVGTTGAVPSSSQATASSQATFTRFSATFAPFIHCVVPLTSRILTSLYPNLHRNRS